MAAKVFNPAGASDNYSTLAAWGGALPLDGDSITIAAGKTCIWDVDQVGLGWTTGVAGLTVTSHATTPAKLTFPTTGGPYSVVMKDGSTIVGTNATVKGQIYIGTSLSGQPVTSPVTFKFLGSATTAGYLNETYLDCQIFDTRSTAQWIRTTGSDYSTGGGAANITLSVDTDITADAFWTNTAINGGLIELVPLSKTTSSWRRTSYVSSTSNSITLALSGATWPATIQSGSFLMCMTRSVTFLWFGGANNVHGFQNYNTVPWTMNCAILKGDNTYQTGNANAIQWGYGWTMNVAISGWANGVTFTRGCSATGGVIRGTNGELSSCEGGSFDNMVVGGGGAWGGSAVQSMASSVFGSNFWLVGCDTGIGNSKYVVYGGHVHGCSSAIQQGTVKLTRTACIGAASGNDANTNDVGPLMSNVTGYSTTLKSAVPVNTGYHQFATLGLTDGDTGVILYDVADSGGNIQYGKINAWYPSGKITTPAASGTPPVTLPFVYRMLWEASTVAFPAPGIPLRLDIPVQLEADTPIRFTIYALCGSSLNTPTWSESPAVYLVDPSYPFGNVSAKIGNSASTSAGAGIDKTNSTTYQTLQLDYLPSQVVTYYPRGAKKNVVLRIVGTISSGTIDANTWMDVAYTQSAIVNANVQYWNGAEVSEKPMTTTEALMTGRM